MDLRKLRHAVTLSHFLNFTRAAEALNLTQPALSRSIRSLEDEWQLKLFERSHSVVAITQAGREFIRHAEAMLRNEAEMRNVVSHVANGQGGRIALGVTPVTAQILLAPVLYRHLSEPFFHAGVVIDTERKMLAMVMDESLDLCICTDPQVMLNAALKPITLARLPLAMLVRSAHPLTRVTDLKAQDVAPFPLIRSRPYEFNDDGPIVVGPSHTKPPAVTVEDYGVLTRLAIHTDAVWVTTPMASQEAIDQGHLVQLAMPWLPEAPYTSMIAYVLKKRTLSPLTQKVLDEIVALSGAWKTAVSS